MTDVIVIAGTRDAREIAGRLAASGFTVTATVTTKYGGELLGEHPGVEVHEGKLDFEGMVSLIKHSGARCLVDASHPFARDASVNSIKACEQAGISYLRFEREETALDLGTRNTDIVKVKTFDEAAGHAAGFDGNIFLTVGSNNLEIFVKKIPDFRHRLFARVLPDSRVLLKCEQLGFTPENIIAVKGPFTEEMNIEMLKHCKASVMVTKESGVTGGVDTKFGAAGRLNIPVILVTRPEVNYPAKTGRVQEVEEFVGQAVL